MSYLKKLILAFFVPFTVAYYLTSWIFKGIK